VRSGWLLREVLHPATTKTSAKTRRWEMGMARTPFLSPPGQSLPSASGFVK
jgi:hypothetical protein